MYLEKVKNDNFNFLIELYTNYIILKKPCSYDLSDYKKNLIVFYKIGILHLESFICLLKKVGRLFIHNKE